MTTATSTDARAFLTAIAADPADDTGRLVLADYLDENGEPERAEFIRVQCELESLREANGGSYPMCLPNHGTHCQCVLRSRETALRTANEAAWRRGPVCGTCDGKGNYKGFTVARCTACDGTGDMGGLMGCSRHEYTVAGHLQQGEITGWRHAVTFARGFPDEVRCKLGEVVEQVEKRFQTYPRDEWGPAEYDTSLEWGVTDWARRVVRHHPVRGFRVTDVDSALQRRDGVYWWRDTALYDHDPRIPAVVSPKEIYPTPEAAHDALACALALLARTANTKLEEART